MMDKGKAGLLLSKWHPVGQKSEKSSGMNFRFMYLIQFAKNQSSLQAFDFKHALKYLSTSTARSSQ